jgi:hypothetical protein
VRSLALVLVAVIGCQSRPRLTPSLPSSPPSAPADVPEKPLTSERTADQIALERSEAERDRQLAALRVAMARDAGPVSHERARYRTRLEETWFSLGAFASRHGRILVGDPDATTLDDTVLFIQADFCGASPSVGDFLRGHEPNRVGFRMLICATMDGTRHEYPLLPRGRRLW